MSVTNEFNKHKKHVSKDLYSLNMMKPEVEQENLTTAGKTQDKHPNLLHSPKKHALVTD